MPLYKAILASEVCPRYLTYTSLVPHPYLTYTSLAFVLYVKIVECKVHCSVTFLQDACTSQPLYFCIVSATSRLPDRSEVKLCEVNHSLLNLCCVLHSLLCFCWLVFYVLHLYLKCGAKVQPISDYSKHFCFTNGSVLCGTVLGCHNVHATPYFSVRLTRISLTLPYLAIRAYM